MSSEPDRGRRRSRGVPADPDHSQGGRTDRGAARDPMGEAAGGEGGDVAGGLGRETGPVSRSARGMTGYLLYPRPEAWAKALIAPAFFVFAASSTGRFGDWKNFLVLWLILEYLIYPARYQWNDIRGIDADREHAEKDARSRLPVGTTARSRRRSIRVSQIAALVRVLAALLIGALAGLARQALLLAAAVFVIAAVYEWLRALRKDHLLRTQVAAVWLVVGLGYLVRGGLGLRLAGLAWSGLPMVAGLACVVAFGIMFVLLTWLLEATSYCVADAAGGWHARAELAAKPHLAVLLRWLGRPISDGPGEGRYCGDDRVLLGGARLSAPWNLALFAAVASGAVEGIALARPRAGGAGLYLAVGAVAVTLALLLARCRSALGRWVITGAGFPALIAAAFLGGTAVPVLVGVPWAAIAVLYSAFHGCSYRAPCGGRPAYGRPSQVRLRYG